jgi:hypothetical protein
VLWIRLELGFERFSKGLETFLGQGAQEVAFVFEVVVGSRWTDPGFSRDGAKGQGLRALPLKHLLRGVHEGAPQVSMVIGPRRACVPARAPRHGRLVQIIHFFHPSFFAERRKVYLDAVQIAPI